MEDINCRLILTAQDSFVDIDDEDVMDKTSLKYCSLGRLFKNKVVNNNNAMFSKFKKS